MEYWEIDLRSRKDGNSTETIFSGESHDEACACLKKWYDEHPEVDIEADRESFVDGTDGVFADIYCTTEPHGVGKWQQKHNLKEKTEGMPMKEKFWEYIRNNFTLDADGGRMIRNIIDWVWEQSMDKEDTVKSLMCLLDGIGIEEEEIERFVNWE